jgi:hypothetical protein
MKWTHFDAYKAIVWVAGLIGVLAPATHWDAGTAAMVSGTAHAIGSWAQGKVGT